MLPPASSRRIRKAPSPPPSRTGSVGFFPLLKKQTRMYPFSSVSTIFSRSASPWRTAFVKASTAAIRRYSCRTESVGIDPEVITCTPASPAARTNCSHLFSGTSGSASFFRTRTTDSQRFKISCSVSSGTFWQIYTREASSACPISLWIRIFVSRSSLLRT